ncbi:putative signaling protein [Halioglobus japonicus]|nr:putative signaling protein [Halioglobus japonicus]
MFIGSNLLFWDSPTENFDPTGALQAAGIDPLTVAQLREGTSEFSHWYMLELYNPGTQLADLLIELGFTSLTDVEVFSFSNGLLKSRYRAGIRLPFSSRPIEHRYPIFPVSVPAGETTVVLLIYNLNQGMLANQLRDNAFLWDEKKFFYRTQVSELIYWLFFGAFVIVILYHAVGAVVTGGRLYLFYTAFCTTYLLMQMSLSGFAFQLFWPDYPVLNLIVLMTSIALVPTILAHFTLAFLDQDERYARLRKWIWGITILCFGLVLPAYIFGFSRHYSPVSVIAILAVLIIAFVFLMGSLGLALLEWRRGNPRGRQFTLAWGLFLAAQSTGIVAWLGLFELGVNQAFISMFGALFSLSLISGYMADRASRSRVKHRLASSLMQINDQLAVEVQERKLAEARAWHLANHDSLTGLPTLRLARERLPQAIELSQRNSSKTAILFIDLDGFKAVNDTWGHEAGDQLLQQMAARMSACVRESDTVARVGGDEFLIIQTGILNVSAITTVAKKLLGALSESYYINRQEIKVSASIGIALCPDHGTDMEDLVKLADTAMYAIKQAGKNNYGFVDSYIG